MNITRRDAIRSMVTGTMLFPAIVQDLLAGGQSAVNPLAPRAPHFPGKAKRLIFLYMTGGVSHVDTFDSKPGLLKAVNEGKKPQRYESYLPGGWEFTPSKATGTEVSSLFPHISGILNEVALIRSMVADHNDHFQASQGLHSGSVTVKRPSMGSWVSYGLGTENQNLP